MTDKTAIQDDGVTIVDASLGLVGGREPYPVLPTAPSVALTEIIWRIDSAPYDRDSGKVARYVPYVNAALCGRLLDEWVGPARWRDSYYDATISGIDVLMCRLEIEVQPGAWVSKHGVGVSPGGNEEMRAKGTVSDAFKRASSLKWGVARNVYAIPSLWAPCKTSGSASGKEVARSTSETSSHLLEQLTGLGWEWDGNLVIGGDE